MGFPLAGRTGELASAIPWQAASVGVSVGRGRAVRVGLGGPRTLWVQPRGEESAHAGVKQLSCEPVCTGEGGKTGRLGLGSRNLGPAAPCVEQIHSDVLNTGDLDADVSQLRL